MGVILSFVSIKGGVGKTTLALETASSLANHFNKRVLLVDANFSAPNVGLYLDLTSDIGLHEVLDDGRRMHTAIYEAHGFDILPALLYPFNGEPDVFKLKKLLDKMKQRYDFIIIDSSPNYNELIPVVAASDKIFIVTTPDNMTLRTSLKAAVLAKKQKTPVEGIIINRIRNPKYELDLDNIEEESEMPVLARIPDHKKMAESLHFKKPLVLHDSKNSISKEIKRFASALVGSPEKPGFFEKLLGLTGFGKEVVNREIFRQKLYESVM